MSSDGEMHSSVAHSIVRRGIIKGTIKRPSKCDFCDAEGYVEAHHHRGYSDPLVFIWLCRKCHREAHVAIRKYDKLNFKSVI